MNGCRCCAGTLPGSRKQLTIFRWPGNTTEALRHGPENPLALYGLAKVLAEQGEAEQAKLYATKCVEAIARSGDEIHEAVLDLIAKRWPDLIQR